jgi:uncharacterized membrane protein YbhN (UPF0104 family)
MRNRRVRQVGAAVVIVATLVAFGIYISLHPAVLSSITSLSVATLLLLTTCYVVTILANAFVLWASLRLIKKPVGFFENISLTGYSSVVNFFGPLQSGPGFRAAYLKTKHGVGLKRFFYVTVVFYGFFALLNGLVIVFALLGTLGRTYVPLAVVGIVLMAAALFLAARGSSKLVRVFQTINVANVNVWYIGLGALVLSLATAAAYFVELTHVDASITFYQALIYGAAANLALFVSLTPGAIGFRESFLLLTQQLHGIAPNTVIAASIIDRAFYVVFLLTLFVVLLVVGARARLKQSNVR